MKFKISLNGRTYEVEVETAEPMTLDTFQSYMPSPVTEVVAPAISTAAEAPAATVSGDGEAVTAPMPGTILKINVQNGQSVKEGDVLCVLEAMKMENEIMAPKNGIITQVVTSKGSSVDTGAVLVFIR